MYCQLIFDKDVVFCDQNEIAFTYVHEMYKLTHTGGN